MCSDSVGKVNGLHPSAGLSCHRVQVTVFGEDLKSLVDVLRIGKPSPVFGVNVPRTERAGQFSAVYPSEDLASRIEFREDRRLVKLLCVLLQVTAPCSLRLRSDIFIVFATFHCVQASVTRH